VSDQKECEVDEQFHVGMNSACRNQLSHDSTQQYLMCSISSVVFAFGSGLEEDLEENSESHADGKRLASSRRRVSNLFWKPPKKLEFGSSRRMNFEMTQASSLKAQARRSSSILATSNSATPAYSPRHGDRGGTERDGMGMTMAMGHPAMEGGGWGEGGYGFGRLPFSTQRVRWIDGVEDWHLVVVCLVMLKANIYVVDVVARGCIYVQGGSDFEYTGGVDLNDVNLTAEQQQLLASALRCIDNFIASHQGRPYEAMSEEELKMLRGAGGGASGMGAFSRSVRAMSMLGGPGARRDSFDAYNQGQRFSVLGEEYDGTGDIWMFFF
jgi:hypothetical protein